MRAKNETEVRLRNISTDRFGMTSVFDLPGIGSGDILFDKEYIIDKSSKPIRSPFGPLPANTEAELKAAGIVSPTVSLDLDPRFSEIEKLHCMLQINGHEFTSVPVKGDELPFVPTALFYNWKETGVQEECVLLLPNNLLKLQQIELKVWTE